MKEAVEIIKNTFYLNLHFKNIFLCTESLSVSHHGITNSHGCEKTQYLQKCAKNLNLERGENNTSIVRLL